MAKIRVGINGFGRIGRNFFRAHLERGGDFEIVAANDIGDTKTMAHLLKHDSVLGHARPATSRPATASIRVGDHEIKFVSRARSRRSCRGASSASTSRSSRPASSRTASPPQKHLDAGAKKVVISAPATDPDVTIVLGVNDRDYDPEQHHIISNASCTTNCVAPLAKVLHEAYTIERGFMTTIHAYTNDQRMLDLPHADLRRARAAAINLIPTSTGRRPRDRARAAGPEGQGRRHVDARARPDRLDRRPRRRRSRATTTEDEVNELLPLEGRHRRPRGHPPVHRRAARLDGHRPLVVLVRSSTAT